MAVHAMGKAQFGGVIEGLTDSYHGPISVKRLPSAAVAKTARKLKIRAFQFNFIGTPNQSNL